MQETEQTNRMIDCAAFLICTWKILTENSLNKQMCQGCLTLLSFHEWVWAGRLSWGNVQSRDRKGKGFWDSSAVADLHPADIHKLPHALPLWGLLEWELLEGVQKAPVQLQLPLNTRGGTWVTELPRVLVPSWQSSHSLISPWSTHSFTDHISARQTVELRLCFDTETLCFSV